MTHSDIARFRRRRLRRPLLRVCVRAAGMRRRQAPRARQAASRPWSHARTGRSLSRGPGRGLGGRGLPVAVTGLLVRGCNATRTRPALLPALAPPHNPLSLSHTQSCSKNGRDHDTASKMGCIALLVDHLDSPRPHSSTQPLPGNPGGQPWEGNLGKRPTRNAVLDRSCGEARARRKARIIQVLCRQGRMKCAATKAQSDCC